VIPRDLPGLDPAWSRHVHVPDADGVARRWHLLDTGPPSAGAPDLLGTVLAVHGNPTWSYLWRRVLQQAPPGWRVIAVDQLGMGYSERSPHPRRLQERIEDLGRLTEAIGLTGPVVVLAHDWGGPISLGWAIRHTDQVRAVVLTNTAVHQHEQEPRPVAIRAARWKAVRGLLTARTPAFVAATTALSGPRLPAGVRRAFAAPYDAPDRRDAVHDFVADIPFEPDHPSHPALSEVSDGVSRLDVPALLVWGARDPVFAARYLRDLQQRMPQADVQVYPRASHLVLEDAPEGVATIWTWIGDTLGTAETNPRGKPAEREPVHSQSAAVDLGVRTDGGRTTAIVELGSGGNRITRGMLSRRVEDVARALRARGVRRGHRVAVLIPPGIDLNTVVYAVWRLGAVVVIADAGLGLGRLGAALRSAGPDHVIGIRAALVLARSTRVPGATIRADSEAMVDLIAEAQSLPSLTAGDAEVGPDDDAAILFTSGATGPPKGVVYTRAQLIAQVTLLAETFGLKEGAGFVAAFAPFALYGPPLGLPCAVPDMDVTAPHTLTAAALADAVAAVEAASVFASPAALRNVVATAHELSAEQREALSRPGLVLSAGAPVPTSLLRQVKRLMPAARTHTPYGMTEVLPVATIDPTQLDQDDLACGGLRSAGPMDWSATEEDDASAGGVCVGPPVAGVSVRIAPWSSPAEDLTDAAGVLGEIVVRGPHVKQRYHHAWGAEQAAARPPGWHRTGDVGYLDDDGRLWVQSRKVHVLRTPHGLVTPYPVEHRVAALPEVEDAAVVGVGPDGATQVVVIVVPPRRIGRRASPLADAQLSAAVRVAAEVPVAAVLRRDWLPVDIRHASKVDRTSLALWADDVLRGRGSGRLHEVLRRVPGVGTGKAAPGTRSR
jgi:acyl-CoA synthetase (AMP-forming)/AMP-acid ligase II/pimeloyl-ACP methyl ester carboxylesterase